MGIIQILSMIIKGNLLINTIKELNDNKKFNPWKIC
jgi:hypothetical protein